MASSSLVTVSLSRELDTSPDGVDVQVESLQESCALCSVAGIIKQEKPLMVKCDGVIIKCISTLTPKVASFYLYPKLKYLQQQSAFSE